MLRVISKQNTEDGRTVKKLLDQGKFAPTPLTIKIVKQRLEKPDAQKGYIFDGFPRSVEQAEMMEEQGIEYDYVVNLVVSEEEIIKRLTARGREDDKPDIIKKRLATYEKETRPLLDYYGDEVINIKAEGSTPEAISKEIIKKVQWKNLTT